MRRWKYTGWRCRRTHRPPCGGSETVHVPLAAMRVLSEAPLRLVYGSRAYLRASTYIINSVPPIRSVRNQYWLCFAQRATREAEGSWGPPCTDPQLHSVASMRFH